MLSPLHFGAADRFVLDPTARTLHAQGEPIGLGSRALELLLVLAEAGGELVTKEQLLQRCWPGLVVEEANVHVQVSGLRKLLGAEAIATVPGLGYRFAWAVRRSGADVVCNLPAARTRFVGRETLLGSAHERLASTRLLTMIGIGGTGKTRLALQLAQRALIDYADGVWWIDIAPLDRPEQLAAAAAQVLGVAARRGRDPAESLPDWLRPRHLLLVLDNCEHLIDAVARLADDWLATAPRLTLLVTSREALGLQGEVVLPVAPLGLPAPQAGEAEVLQAEAVRLFLDRATAAAPGFELGVGEAPAIAEICRRVDGIPLALELAAAQLRVVSPAQLLALLEERFRLLTSQRRALPRQQTMQAVIRWSYEHLRPEEQSLLMALATCSGGCDLDAAAALMGAEMPRIALLAALSRLVELSLLVVQHGPGPARYHLLETVRQFAFDRLQEGDRGPLLRSRHAAHFLALAEAWLDEAQRSGESAGQFAHIDVERENLLHVLDACVHDDIPDAAATGLRLLAAMKKYWLARGVSRMGTEMGLVMLARADALPPDLPRVVVLCVTAFFLLTSGRADEAHRVALQALRAAEAVGVPARLAAAHEELGSSLCALGRHDEGRAHHEAACRIALEAGDRERYADALCRMGHAAIHRGDLQQATPYFDVALPIRLASIQGWRVVGAAVFGASLAIRLGDTQRARELLCRAAAVLPRVGSIHYAQYLVDYTGQLAALHGHWPLVARLGAATAGMPTPASASPALHGHDDQARQALLQRARDALGDPAFDGAWAAGLNDGLARAVAIATQWLDDAAQATHD